jgi:hypothetical protein
MRAALSLRVCAALLVSGLAWATTYRTLTLDEMLAQTDVAFYGQVSEVVTELRDGDPWTLVTFDVLRPLAGLGEDAASLQLAFFGGVTEEGAAVSVSLMPSFAPGELVVVLAYDAPYYSPIVGFRQGLWRRGAAGWQDETGRPLGLADGALEPGGLEGDAEAVLDALAAALEARP